MKYLLLYSSHDGHTKRIVSTIADRVCVKDVECDIGNLKERQDYDLTQYSKVLIGASIRYGYFSRAVRRYAIQNEKELNARTTAFVGVNLTARKEGKNTPETNAYVRKFLEGTPWKPTAAAVFAGALYYPRYNTFDRVMIRFIMRITGGETDTTKEIVYTDWKKVDEFADKFASLPATPLAITSK